MRSNWWRPSRLILMVSNCILLLVSSNLNWAKDYWKGILRSDARGYYAWLPALFIHHDLQFDFQETVENPQTDPRHRAVYRVPVDNTYSNKYFIGTASAELPFFLIAHSITLLTRGTADGYSFFYQLFINLAGIFYALAGLIFLRRLLLNMHFSEAVVSWTIVALLFASNLFYYSIIEPGMSHIYSFAFASAFLYAIHAWLHFAQKKHLLLAAFCLGMMVLIRPVNGLLLFTIPLLGTSLSDVFARIKTAFFQGQLLFPVMLFSAIVAIQPLIWYVQTGHLVIDSYPGEDFHFLEPHVFAFLFSYKKGAFLYTPILMIALLGYGFVPKLKRPQLYYGIGWGALLIYVLSSWWNWWYGGSFSSRVLVEFLPFFAIGLALLLQQKQSAIKVLSRSLVVICLVLCQIQVYQYRYYLIHWENMTQERYWEVFLKTKSN